MTIPEGYAQVTQTFTGSGFPNGAAVVYGIDVGEIITPAFAATTARDAWASSMRTSQGLNTVMSETIVKFGPDDTGPTGVATGGGGGLSGGTQGAPNVTWLLTKQTAMGGRRGRGRMFVPGVVETGVEVNGDVTAANLTQLQSDATELLTTLTSGGIPMVLLHDPPTEWVLIDGQPRRVPTSGVVPAPDLVLSLVASSRVATQRRRLRT